MAFEDYTTIDAIIADFWLTVFKIWPSPCILFRAGRHIPTDQEFLEWSMG
jgi:hypothetical protein